MNRHIPTWKTLSRIGNLPVWRASAIFLAVVPIISRVFATLPEKVLLTQFHPPIELHLSLPFSWKLLYIAAILLILGHLIYFFFAPKIITMFEDFSAFRTSGRGSPYLFSLLHNQLPERQNEETPTDFYRRVYMQETFRFSFPDSPSSSAQFANELALSPSCPDLSPISFWFAYDYCSYQAPAARAVCLVLFGLGLVAVGWVFIQNVIVALAVIF